MSHSELNDPNITWVLIHLACWAALLFLMGMPTEEDKKDDHDDFY